jgi:putative ABC transport system permease protein
MLLSYLKIAWKVLLRRRFFTFISLFGISFTLMILLVVYAMYDHAVGPHTPERRVDRLLFITRMRLWSPENQSNSNVGYSFLNRYVRTLRTPEKVSIATSSGSVVSYLGNHKLKLDLRATDGEFWQVLDFDFLAGRPYTVQEVREAAHVAVINESTSRRYFGTTQAVIGRTLEADAIRYRVVGVVRDVPATRESSFSDLWIPITVSTVNLRDPNYLGDCIAIILAPSAADRAAVQEEFARVISQVPIQDPKDYTEVRVYAEPMLTNMVRGLMEADGPDPGVSRFAGMVAGLSLLFMLLPALNLVNLNISRMLERSSEIGVRKAFGATNGTLIGQFLVENVFLTLLGGILGLILAAVALHLLNTSSFIDYAHFALNRRVFLVGLGGVLFFGILSGVYPAYKMSKLQAVEALKGGTNA